MKKQYSAEYLDTLRSSIRLSEIVGQHVTLKPQGADLVGLCPFHNEKTASFTITDSKCFFHCFGCNVSGDVFTWLIEYLGMSFTEAVATVAQQVGLYDEAMTHAGRIHTAGPIFQGVARQKDQAELRRSELAGKVLRQTKQIGGSSAAQYLIGRSITVDLPPSLRFHPSLAHKQSNSRLPAMVATITTWPDDRVVGIHRTYLCEQADGTVQKAAISPNKMMLGRTTGGACRLAPAAKRMALATGIETSLSFMQMACISTWASLSDGGLARVILPPLPFASDLIIAADLDPSGQGEAAAIRAADRFVAEGRTG